jgi:hypothetical protein
VVSGGVERGGGPLLSLSSRDALERLKEPSLRFPADGTPREVPQVGPARGSGGHPRVPRLPQQQVRGVLCPALPLSQSSRWESEQIKAQPQGWGWGGALIFGASPNLFRCFWGKQDSSQAGQLEHSGTAKSLVLLEGAF